MTPHRTQADAMDVATACVPERRGTRGDTGEPKRSQSPWDRFGWAIGGIWLVFLGFPLANVLTDEHPTGVTVAGVAILVAFAAIYLHGFASVAGSPDKAHRKGLRTIALLTLLAIALAFVIGAGALGVLTYLCAVGAFTLRLRWAYGVYAAVLATSIAVGIVAHLFPDAWWFWGITALVGGFCLLMRVFEERDEEHRETTHALALSDQREGLARDVHDVLGHTLTVLTVRAEVAERMIDLDPERAKAELQQIRALTRQALAEVRSTVAGLRVARLADEADHAAAALRSAGIEAHLPADARDVDPTHRITLSWALREAVTNVVRHAHAKRCDVTWGEDWLEVVDDGNGIRKTKEGNGIRGLRERIAESGGHVEIGPGPDGRGTRVRVDLGSPA